MARVVHLYLDAGPMGPTLVRIGAHGRAFAQVLSAAVAVIHHRVAAPELQQLDNRTLHDLGLHREGQAVWQHLDASTSLEPRGIVRPR